MPFLLVRREDPSEDVLVRPVFAAAILLRLALFDADLRDEDDIVEVPKTVRRARACSLTSLGLMLRADSRMLRRMPREISAA
jgi:hypothetical protein